MRSLLFLVVTGFLHLACRCSVAIAQIPFTQHTVDNTLNSCSSLWVDDMDGDGDRDIIAGYNFAGISWWRNELGGQPPWTRQQIATGLVGVCSVISLDLNQDQQPEVASAAWDDATVSWWGYEDNWQWVQHIIDDNAAGAHEVHAVDLDDDGDLDLLAALAEDDEIVWYSNEGGFPPAWTRRSIQSGFGGARSVTTADFDLDGDLDVVGAALDDDAISWWRQDWSDSTVWTEFPITTVLNMAHRVAVADLDNDGDVDILATGYGGHIVIWVNQLGDPVQWTEIEVDGEVPNALQAHPVDLNDDGWFDIVGTSDTGDAVLAWYSGGPSLTEWTEQILTDSFNGPWPILTADLDNDDDQDIVCSAYGAGGEIAWWERADEWLVPAASATPRTGHAPLSVQFQEETWANPPVTYWGWNFDNDEDIDLEEPNPLWIYTEPGTYSVGLYVSNGQLPVLLLLEDYIQVFTGESALAFAVPGDHAVCNGTATLNLTGALTIEAWINPAGWGQVPGLGYGRIIDKQSFKLYLVGEHPAWTDQCLLLELIHEGGGVSRSCTPAGSVTLDSLLHVAATYDGTGEVAIYLNGTPQLLEQTVLPDGPLMDNLDLDLFIGNSIAQNTAFQGMLDEIRLWEIVRSASEIEEWLHSDLHGFEPGLVADWQFDEGNGDVIHDNANHLPPGSVNGALWVEGVDQNLNAIQTPPLQNDPSGFTLLAVYPNPANPTTTIEFQLPLPVAVSLEVYNLLGEKVITLLREATLPTGIHQIDWDCHDMPSGLYFIALQGAGQSVCRKMIILE
ncbi:MAG: VCBS repeat-containing protein [Candidatus Delongbacteria bacterium]|nr:VCBS repeat-containing protein [Candidatus Delongbacteria bacterium]